MIGQAHYPGRVRALAHAPMLAISLLCLAAACADVDDDGFATDEDPATAWTPCAADGQRCVFTGTREVRYGTRTRYTIKTFSNGVDCNSSVFGDPARGQTKTCSYGAELAPSTPPTPTPPPTTSPTLPTQICTSPLVAADTSRPTTVVGTGTAVSCTETLLRAAVAKGGVVTFNCGAASMTIAITQTLLAPWDKDTVIDGGDKIVLDGRGTTQILRAEHGDFRVNDRALTVQRLAMINGRDVGTGFQARNGSTTCAWGYRAGGGGAIYTRDVNLRVWGVRFENNRGPELGPDVAGGAIYMVGAKKLVVANSTFRNNSASNGGAIGVLHVASELYNVVLEQNRASGLLANFANATGCPTFNHAEQGGAGGLGGAFYSDGFDPGDTFCGVRMADNISGDLGGAVFRSAYWGLIPDSPRQAILWDRSTFERNKATAGGGGAAYLNNSAFTMRACSFLNNDSGASDGGALKLTGLTVRAENLQFSNNRASWGGGVAHWGPGIEGVGSASNVRYTTNTPNDYVGDFPH